MFRFIKFLFTLACLGAFVWFGMSVPLGRYTLFQHVSRIWNTQETQDMVKGVKETAGPAVDRAERAVKKGVEEAQKP
jgi:hypothetical protein